MKIIALDSSPRIGDYLSLNDDSETMPSYHDEIVLRLRRIGNLFSSVTRSR